MNKSLSKRSDELDEAWEKALKVEKEAASDRTDRELLEEVLELVRNENRLSSIFITPIATAAESSILSQPSATSSPPQAKPLPRIARPARMPSPSSLRYRRRETKRSIREWIGAALGVDPEETTLSEFGTRVIANVPTEPTEDDQTAVDALGHKWGYPSSRPAQTHHSNSPTRSRQQGPLTEVRHAESPPRALFAHCG